MIILVKVKSIEESGTSAARHIDCKILLRKIKDKTEVDDYSTDSLLMPNIMKI